MKSYYLVEYNHDNNQFSFADYDLAGEILDVGDCYTTDAHLIADLEKVGVFPEYGWYWSRFDKTSNDKVEAVRDRLSNLLLSNSISPKSFLARLKGGVS